MANLVITSTAGMIHIVTNDLSEELDAIKACICKHDISRVVHKPNPDPDGVVVILYTNGEFEELDCASVDSIDGDDDLDNNNKLFEKIHAII